MNDEPEQTIRFAEFELDAAHHKLRRSGETLALNAKAFDLLVYLTKNAGRVVTKDELLDAVWENQFVEEANLKVQISALRKALGERKDHRFLVTIPGKGYKFVADIQSNGNEIVIEKHKFSRLVVEEEITDAETRRRRDAEIFDAEEDSLIKRPDLRQNSASLRLVVPASLIVVFIIVAGGYWLFNRTSENRGGSFPVFAEEKQPRIKRLTNQGRINRAKIWPDGKFFAYTLMQRGSFQTEIRLGQTDGGSDVLLRPASNVFHHPITFSADGNWLYYVETAAVSEYKDSRGAFFKTPVLPGVPQKLAENTSIYAVLSPDEKQIAFPRNKTPAIVISDLDGSNEREIVVSQAIDTDSLSWSADGRFIAFSAAVNGSKFEVFVVRTADSSVEQLTSLGWNAVGLLEWLKDGTGLVAVARSREQNNSSSLWQIDYPGGKTERLSRDVNRYAGALSLSANSNALAAVQSELETNLWVAPTENPAVAKQITFSTSGRMDGWNGMDWTPDGRIVSTAWVDESLTIWAMDANGENARQLTSIGFRDEKPAVSADGKTIVFQSNRSGATEIWRMNMDGSNLQQITTDGGNSSPSISPDGVWVVYRHTGTDGSSLRRIPLSGGEPLLIVDKNVLAPQISPDGQFIACALTIDGATKLTVFPFDGGEPKVFALPKTHNFRSNSTTRWSSDGRFIYYSDESNGIWQQDIRGGEPQRLAGIPAEKTFSFGFSRDGQQLAFGRAREVRDAVLLTDFR